MRTPRVWPSLAEMGLIGINTMVLWSGEHTGRGPTLVHCARTKAGGAHCIAARQEIAIQ